VNVIHCTIFCNCSLACNQLTWDGHRPREGWLKKEFSVRGPKYFKGSVYFAAEDGRRKRLGRNQENL